ncbi:hypothetical protein AB0J14_19580 [Micromonospora arborensis]|uniref:hypothetical protein n=1 Tax=Micromonospora arborensis TaxID=2116518 RepID=UPI0033EBD07C
MNEIEVLREMRANVPVPGPQELMGAQERLRAASAAESGRGATLAPGRWWLPRPAVRVAVAAAAVGVVAVGAVFAAGGDVLGPGEDGAGSAVVAEQPPNLQLVAAAQATGQTSFKLTVSPSNQSARAVQEGAYDPVAKRGFLAWTDQHGNRIEQRVIGDDLYLISPVDGRPGQARKMTGSGRGFRIAGVPAGGTLDDGERVLTGVDGALSVDPDKVLEILAEAGTVEKAGSSGGVATYTFRYVPESLPEQTVVGTVEVRSGKVSKLTYALAGHPLTETVMVFSDYGTPVNVERPAV